MPYLDQVSGSKSGSLFYQTETVLWGSVPTNICTGFQDVCSGSSYVNRKKLVVARYLAVVSTNCMVPIKILNATSELANLEQSKALREFQILDETYNILRSGKPPSDQHSPDDASQTYHCSQQ